MALRNKDETGAEDTFEKVLAKLNTICRTVEEHFKLEDEPEELHRQELRVRPPLIAFPYWLPIGYEIGKLRSNSRRCSPLEVGWTRS